MPFAGIQRPVDLVIALDTTKGTDKKTVHAAKALLMNLLKSYEISHTGTRVGVISYSKRAEELLPLQSGHDRSTVERHIDQAVQLDGPRNLKRAVSKAYDVLVSQTYRGRQRDTSKQLLLLVLEGDASTQDFEALSSQLRANEIKPIVVAVGVQHVRRFLPLVRNSKDLIAVDSPKMTLSALGKAEQRSAKNAGKFIIFMK